MGSCQWNLLNSHPKIMNRSNTLGNCIREWFLALIITKKWHFSGISESMSWLLNVLNANVAIAAAVDFAAKNDTRYKMQQESNACQHIYMPLILLLLYVSTDVSYNIEDRSSLQWNERNSIRFYYSLTARLLVSFLIHSFTSLLRRYICMCLCLCLYLHLCMFVVMCQR